MSDDSNKKSELDNYRSEMSSVIVNQIFKIVAAERKEHGENFSRELALTVLSSTIATILYRSLHPHTPRTSDPRQHDGKQKHYSIMKAAIESAVSSGFAGAFLNLDEAFKDEFLCQIHRIGEPANKLPA